MMTTKSTIFTRDLSVNFN